MSANRRDNASLNQSLYNLFVIITNAMNDIFRSHENAGILKIKGEEGIRIRSASRNTISGRYINNNVRLPVLTLISRILIKLITKEIILSRQVRYLLILKS